MTHPTTAADVPAEKWLQCNGAQLKKLAQAGLFWLEKNHQKVNELNVFPVPDGDTGTNMLLTMRSAWRQIEPHQYPQVGKMAHELAQGALMGARGNSGVILSQIWRGLAFSLEGKPFFTAVELSQALQTAVETAYRGVMNPVEGTILTVIREIAEEAQEVVLENNDLRLVLARVIGRGQSALQRTPEMLPILKQAGVVDSGGQGLIFVLEGMLKYVNGELNNLPEHLGAGTGFTQATPAQSHAVPEGGFLKNHYDVQFLLMGHNLNVEMVRQTIDAMGDSTVIVGDERLIKVHVHVDDPGRPLSYAIGLGEITDVVVENMQLQMEEIVGTSPPPSTPQTVVEPGQIAVVMVAAGPGLGRIFTEMGAAGVVPGGQTNNPSTEEILAAVENLPTDKIILLPNNKNIILTCEAVRDLSPKQVVVIPSRTTPQGVAALLALNPNGELEEVAEAMQESLGEVTTLEITQATRSVVLDGVAVTEGQMIGLLDGKLKAAGASAGEVLHQLLSQVPEIEEREIVTLFYGADIGRKEAEQTAGQILGWYPNLQLDLQEGGQPHYFYILGIE